MNLRVLSPALEEIANAAAWFDSQRSGLGYEFWRAVDDTLDRIKNRPLEFGRSDFASPEHDLRFAIVRRFNHVIYFLVESEEVQVAAIAHAARRPGYWIRRVK